MKTIRNWHNKSTEETLSALKATLLGLNASDVKQRLSDVGLNKLPTAKPKSAFLRFLFHFHNILIYVLLGASVITASLAHFVDTFVIIAVVIINALIGFFQEGKAGGEITRKHDISPLESLGFEHVAFLQDYILHC